MLWKICIKWSSSVLVPTIPILIIYNYTCIVYQPCNTQDGSLPVHIPSRPHFLWLTPSSSCSEVHIYVAMDPYLVPFVKEMLPLDKGGGGPQSITGVVMKKIINLLKKATTVVEF